MKEEKQNKQDPRDIYKIDGIKTFVSEDQAKLKGVTFKKDTWGPMKEKTKTVLDKLVEAQKDAGIKMTTAFNELSDRINEFVKQESEKTINQVDISEVTMPEFAEPFQYKTPTPLQIEKMAKYRAMLSDIYIALNKDSQGRAANIAKTKLEEAGMWINKAITH